MTADEVIPAVMAEHWLMFDLSDDEVCGPIAGCHCGFRANPDDCGYGDSVIAHIITAALLEAAA